MPLPIKVRGMDPFGQLQEQVRRNLGILPTPDFRSETIQDENDDNDPNWQGPQDQTVLQKAFPHPAHERVDDKIFEPPSRDWAANQASKLPPKYQEAGGRALSLLTQGLEFGSRPENVPLMAAGLMRNPEPNPNISYPSSDYMKQAGYGATEDAVAARPIIRSDRMLGKGSEIAPKLHPEAPAFAKSHALTTSEASDLLKAGHTPADFDPNTDAAFRAHQAISMPPDFAPNDYAPPTVKPMTKPTEQAQYDLARDKFNMGRDLPEVKAPEQPQFMRVPNPKGERDNIAMGGADTRVLDILGTALYTHKAPRVVAKELLQNSFDEHRIAGRTDPIVVAVNQNAKHPVTGEKSQSLTVKDSGRGLTPDELYTVFSDVGKTGKGGVESASGGFGLAKAAPLLSGKYVHVESIVDENGQKVKYTFKGTPKEIKNQQVGVPLDREILPSTAKTGLRVTTYFPENAPMYHAGEVAKNTAQYSPSVTSDLHFGQTYGGDDKSLNEFLDNPVFKPRNDKGSQEIGNFDYNPFRRNSDVYTKKETEPKQDSIEIPGAKINLHYEDKPTSTSSQYKLHFLNKGLYQDSIARSYGQAIDNVPENITADIHSTVEEGDDNYPFGANREAISDGVKEAIDNWIKKNIVSGAQEKQRDKLIGLYQAMDNFPVKDTVRKPMFFDAGERLTPDEKKTFTNSGVLKQLVQEFDSMLEDITSTLDVQSQHDKHGEHLEGVGLLLNEGTYGIHIPNPDQKLASRKSTILINPLEHISLKNSPREAAIGTAITVLHEAAHIADNYEPENFSIKEMHEIDDPKIGEFIQEYLKHVDRHGGINAGHDMAFVKRLAEVFTRYGPTATFDSIDRIHEAITDYSGKYNAEVQKLLHIYKESRGRDESSEDFLSTTGVKQKSSEGGEGSTSGSNKANGIGTVKPIKGKSSSSFSKVEPIR